MCGHDEILYSKGSGINLCIEPMLYFLWGAKEASRIAVPLDNLEAKVVEGGFSLCVIARGDNKDPFKASGR